MLNVRGWRRPLGLRGRNHLKICVIHDIDQYEGQTLKQRTGVGAGLAPPKAQQAALLLLDTPIDLVIQIPDALDVAYYLLRSVDLNLGRAVCSYA